ncbi:MAG TPA: (Fe-S)-binding protein [Solirubrobacterales bacterium]|nr:(Fe-S)-binding protein [Solirubrobacterales bacterium]
MRVGLFITCLTDTLYPEAGIATVEVLERLGHTVVVPAGQTCCGQMHANSGYAEEALPLVWRFVRAFGGDDLDAVVAPSGSCVAMVRHHYPRLAAEAGDAALADAVAVLAPRVFELTELLVEELGVEDVGASYPHRVAYHPSCHGLRTLRLGDKPLRLLRNVGGIELVELEEAEGCCGFGGTFAVKNADVSAAMLADKVRAVLGSGAEVCTATDSSCLMQIGGALRRGRTGVRAVHIAEILAAREGA